MRLTTKSRIACAYDKAGSDRNAIPQKEQNCVASCLMPWEKCVEFPVTSLAVILKLLSNPSYYFK